MTGAGAVGPQRTPRSVTAQRISLAAARVVISGAERAAAELGIGVAVAVVDPAGLLVAFAAGDGVPILPRRIAQQKAWSAASLGIGTHEWWSMVENDPPLLHGITHQQDLIVFPGGLPIVSDNALIHDALIGAVGVSGGHYSQDQSIAQAGIDALEESD